MIVRTRLVCSPASRIQPVRRKHFVTTYGCPQKEDTPDKVKLRHQNDRDFCLELTEKQKFRFCWLLTASTNTGGSLDYRSFIESMSDSEFSPENSQVKD